MGNPIHDIEKQQERELTQKERLFCRYFCQGMSASKAALAAGYVKFRQPYVFLHHPSIQKEIKRLNAEFDGTILVTHEQKLLELWDIVETGDKKERIAAIAELNKMQQTRPSQIFELKVDAKAIVKTAADERIAELLEKGAPKDE